MGAITNDWLKPLSPEFKKPYYAKLYQTIKSEYETRQIFPAVDDIFNRRVGKFLPADPPMRIGLMGAHRQHGVQHENSLAGPFHQISVVGNTAHNGFFGSRPFSQTNRFLEENGLEPIDWQIENR